MAGKEGKEIGKVKVTGGKERMIRECHVSIWGGQKEKIKPGVSRC